MHFPSENAPSPASFSEAKIDPSSVDYLHVDDEDAQEDAEAQAEDEKKLDAKSLRK